MRNEEPMTTEVRDMVLRIMERAMYYNKTPTRIELTGDKPTFDIQFSGRTGKLFYHKKYDSKAVNEHCSTLRA